MSTIFGVYCSEKAGISESHGMSMLVSMNHWHADATGSQQEDQIYLGHLMLHNTPESLLEKNPLELNGCMITADARIDNRDEILSLLKEFRQVYNDSPDNLLIICLYLKFGQDCLSHIIGDFSFAIWDGRSQELFCARDHMGVRPFFYYAHDGLFVFASEKKGILAHPFVDATPDEDFMLRLMADLRPDASATSHLHIRHLPPGHCLRINRDGISIRRYWTLEAPPLLRLHSAGEYEEAFREQLSRAVGCRLRTVFPIASELSGGLDSSAVTAFAALLVKDKNRLHTFTNIVEPDAQGVKILEDEEPYADALIRHCGIRHVVKVSRSDRGHFTESLDLDIAVNSGVDIISAFWLEPFRRGMQQRGIRVSLSGFFGDEVVTNPGRNYFMDLPAEGRIVEFVRVCLQKGKYGLPFKQLMKSCTPAPMLDRWRRSHYRPPVRRSLLSDSDLDLRLERSVEESGRVTSGHKQHLLKLASGIYSQRRLQSEALYGIMHRIEPRYPLADIRLLTFFLSLPSSVIGHPHTERYLYRKSLGGIVPDEILWRMDKNVPAGVFYLEENRKMAADIRNWLHDIRNQRQGRLLNVLDFDKIDQGLDPDHPDNQWNGRFYPNLSFSIQALIRYLTMHEHP